MAFRRRTKRVKESIYNRLAPLFPHRTSTTQSSPSSSYEPRRDGLAASSRNISRPHSEIDVHTAVPVMGINPAGQEYANPPADMDTPPSVGVGKTSPDEPQSQTTTPQAPAVIPRLTVPESQRPNINPPTASHCAVQSTVSLPDMLAVDSPLVPATRPVSLQPETDATHTWDSTENLREPKLRVGPPGQGHTSLQPPTVTTRTQVVTASATPSSGTSTGRWTSLNNLLGVVKQSAGVFGPFKEVIEELVGCIGIYDGVAKGRDEFNALREELERLFDDLQQHLSQGAPPILTTCMEGICKSILRELGDLKKKEARSTTRRYLEARRDIDSVLACYRRIQGHLHRLSLNANLSMWKMVDIQAVDARLDRLSPSLSACYNSKHATDLKRGACTPGTRIDVLGQALSWVHSRAAGSVYWLNGMAGTGKTTIAYSLCEELDATHNLGASFFCSRLLPQCRDVNQIVPSISYQLARFSHPFRSALSRVLEKERDVHTQLLHIQFDMLVIKPLVEVQHTLPEDLVVVIDALDECDSKQSTAQILEALLLKTPDLPIKFFIASRPEPEIRDQMNIQWGRQTISRLVLHELDKDIVQGDIETYLKVALKPINPSPSDIAALVYRAGVLFIYAATVVRFIGYDNFGRNPRSRLQTILSISPSTENHVHKEMNELYSVILEAGINDPGLSNSERDEIKLVLYTVLCAREPLTISTLCALLGLQDVGRVHAALRPLWSVLHIVESNELVTMLHASFPDFMFDPERSKGFYCNSVKQNCVLARCCFNRIKDTKPQFNICSLESSYVRDDQVANLDTRVQKAISPELPYACRHWATHLERAEVSSELIELLGDFMSERLLLWMEIMNLKKCMDVGVGVMLQAEEWCVRFIRSKEVIQLARDAWRFVTAFATSPVSTSTPHIYISMLPFWPESSPVSRHYAGRARVPMAPRGSAISLRSLEVLATWSLDGQVKGVAWSPDGTRIALAAGGQLFLLGTGTGWSVVGPLQLTSGAAQSVGFSPNSTRIAYGTEEGTVGVWDAASERTMLGPLRGHKNSITSVAFSPDGGRIVSGSDDNTIRLWDAQSGEMVLGPLEGHIYSVTSVSFSPDGTRIISGSWDKTIRLWDVQNGHLLLDPLKGHTRSVASVAFSPDGGLIASGSYDNTIRIWDSRSGLTVLGPLKRHHALVTSVVFSPDGKRIASSSWDNDIIIWDTQGGHIVLGPLKGHAHWVTSVAFSPDGTRIVSGSLDNTVRMWDARSIQTDLGPLEGGSPTTVLPALSSKKTPALDQIEDEDEDEDDSTPSLSYVDDVNPETRNFGVSSVAFSPDGACIVSGSWDNTISVWDAETGQIALGPLEGHTRPVTAVAFSPDSTRIASGSQDNTIGVWDVQSGHRVLGLLRAHTDTVTLVTFSPDGAFIASGSNDCTISIWDAQNGQIVFGPLEGHTHSVTAVAFSPSGTHIVSGSSDNTICIWDMKGGRNSLAPLCMTVKLTPAASDETNQTSTFKISSVVFSPDGACIAAGSCYNTMCLWDAQSGQIKLGPFQGHALFESVTIVAFSPHGNKIATGSDENTLHVRDARTGETLLDLLHWRSPNRLITSIAFSPDGTRVACGSTGNSNSVQVWDVRNEERTTPLCSNSAPTISWKINRDGWVLDLSPEPRLLIWVPSELRPVLLPPRNILAPSIEKPFVALNFTNTRIGELWTEFYEPDA